MLAKNQKGQTLIETIIAVGVIAIVVTALIGMGVVAMKTAAAARNQSQAVKLANEGMEKARAVRDQSGLASVVDLSESIDIDGDGDDDFTRVTTVTGPADKKTVVVAVTWTESSGTKSVSVSSYLTDWR